MSFWRYMSTLSSCFACIIQIFFSYVICEIEVFLVKEIRFVNIAVLEMTILPHISQTKCTKNLNLILLYANMKAILYLIKQQFHSFLIVFFELLLGYSGFLITLKHRPCPYIHCICTHISLSLSSTPSPLILPVNYRFAVFSRGANYAAQANGNVCRACFSVCLCACRHAEIAVIWAVRARCTFYVHAREPRRNHRARQSRRKRLSNI